MKIVNETKWATGDLKALTLAVLKHSGQSAPRMLIVRTSKGYVHGRAPLNSRHNVKMFIPRTMKTTKVMGSDGRSFQTAEVQREFPVESYAQVLIHEVGHNDGLNHKEMASIGKIPIPEAILAMKVEPKASKPKPRVDYVAKRRLHALVMLRWYEGRLKRTEQAVKRWARKVKYYQRKQEREAEDGG
jgi:hypothetical protein